MTAPRTAKERVRAKYPASHCWKLANHSYMVSDGAGKEIGWGRSPASTWASAARKLGKE